MSTDASQPVNRNTAKWMFLAAYGAACFVFWWLSPLLYRVLLDSEEGLNEKVVLISVWSIPLFVGGYLLPWRNSTRRMTTKHMLDLGEDFAYKATLAMAMPAFLVASAFTLSRLDLEYIEGPGIPLYYQAVLYIHLFFGLLFLGAASDDARNRPRIYLVALLTILPRLIVSFKWGRFFAAQAIIPVIFIALARGWLRVSVRRLVQFGILALFIVIVPPLTRGDKLFGEDEQGGSRMVTFFQAGNTLEYFQDNLDLPWTCPPLLVSITSKVVPYHLLGVCILDVGDDKDVPATLDNLLTHVYLDDLRRGTGGNFLLDLYLLWGIEAIVVGTVVFGFTCRRFVEWIGRRSLYAGIWAECLSRALLAPRGNLGYTYERIPSLVLATWLVIGTAWGIEVLKRPAKTVGD